MASYKQVANPGNALGEAIGASMESALEELLTGVADEYNCHYLTSGVRQTGSGSKVKKLLMSDNHGNEYDIDGVMANEAMQPLIIFKSKYIRYKKHNRDKGSWICTAHCAVRRRYHSIRSSIAVLAGSWSGSSQAMMRSNDINLFLVPFEYICEILHELNVEFDWDEKDKEKSQRTWFKFNKLNNDEKASVGKQMVARIEDKLTALIEKVLDDQTEREVAKVVVELISNLGEVKLYEFDCVNKALEFLGQDTLADLFITTNSLTLFDPPPEIEE